VRTAERLMSVRRGTKRDSLFECRQPNVPFSFSSTSIIHAYSWHFSDMARCLTRVRYGHQSGLSANGITEDQKDASRRSQRALCRHRQDLSDFVPVPKCQRHGVLDVDGAWQKLLVGV
jgi:hypothetical protein